MLLIEELKQRIGEEQSLFRAQLLKEDVVRLAKLEELARSIKAKGIIQPILVRPAGDGYRIIAGERRWRAAQRAGLLKVPVVVRDLADGSGQQLLELALIENVQRENLNPIDQAVAYQRLADQFALTQEQIAAAVGKDRSSVANFIRLLKLPEEVRADLSSGALTMGHARTLLGLPDAAAQRHAAREVISRVLAGEPLGTRFPAITSRMESRKRWVLAETVLHSRITTDDGAARALTTGGKSLLPAGIVEVEGEFERGQTIRIYTNTGQEIARGLAQYSARDLRLIKGLRSERIAETLGYDYGPEVVHRDDMVIV